ncbi:MAG: IS200/IS605 family transposase [Arenicella sp.]|nr:IS200/IS605 family transposase [Arenicella sp.]
MDIVELEIPVDHIHMLIRSEPKTSPPQVMLIIKSISARPFFKLRAEIKKKYVWGAKLWTQVYFVEMIGNANKEVTRAYVQYQLKAMNEYKDDARQQGLF